MWDLIEFDRRSPLVATPEVLLHNFRRKGAEKTINSFWWIFDELSILRQRTTNEKKKKILQQKWREERIVLERRKCFRCFIRKFNFFIIVFFLSGCEVSFGKGTWSVSGFAYFFYFFFVIRKIMWLWPNECTWRNKFAAARLIKTYSIFMFQCKRESAISAVFSIMHLVKFSAEMGCRKWAAISTTEHNRYFFPSVVHANTIDLDRINGNCVLWRARCTSQLCVCVAGSRDQSHDAVRYDESIEKWTTTGFISIYFLDE